MLSDQDMFADVEDNDTDPDEPTQVEFSGISASGSTISPEEQQQQPAPAPTPTLPPSPVPSSSDASTTCGICGRKLASQRGLRTHITRSHKGETVPEAAENPPAPTSVPSTPTAAAANSAQKFICSVCQNDKITTQKGFVKHQAAHKKDDIYKKMPQPSDFHAEMLEDTALDILNEILNEPNYNNSLKNDFIQGLVDNRGRPEWWNFFNMLQNFILSAVCKLPTKILPANEFEEHQTQLNKFLNVNNIELQERLQSASPIAVSSSLAGRISLRIASKLLQKTQVWVLKKICEDRVAPTVSPRNMPDEEKNAFLTNLGSLFQLFYKKQKSKFPRECECLKSTFVGGQHPIPSAQFLDSKNWFSGEEWCITPSNRASDFFISIELGIIPSLLVSKGQVTSQTVIEGVLESESLLSDWFYLTNQFLSEDSSLDFMRKLVSVFVASSLLFEEKKKNRAEENTIRATSVALRTHLQKNYVEKDNNIEDVV